MLEYLSWFLLDSISYVSFSRLHYFQIPVFVPVMFSVRACDTILRSASSPTWCVHSLRLLINFIPLKLLLVNLISKISPQRRSFNILTSFSFLRPSRHDHIQFVSAPLKSSVIILTSMKTSSLSEYVNFLTGSPARLIFQKILSCCRHELLLGRPFIFTRYTSHQSLSFIFQSRCVSSWSIAVWTELSSLCSNVTSWTLVWSSLFDYWRITFQHSERIHDGT